MIGATDQRTTSGPVDTILHAKEAEDMTAPTISATPKKPLISGRHPDMAAFARTPVLPEATPVDPLPAQSAVSGREQRTRSFDPELPFDIGAVNGR